MADKIKVTIWNEYRHERDGEAKEFYPRGIHETIREFLAVNEDMEIKVGVLDDPDQGLPDEVLNNTDVLIWWGHMHHGKVEDALVEKSGSGFTAAAWDLSVSILHITPSRFRAIVGCTGNLKWGDNQKEVVWNLFPSHPIAQGLPDSFELERRGTVQRTFLHSPA